MKTIELPFEVNDGAIKMWNWLRLNVDDKSYSFRLKIKKGKKYVNHYRFKNEEDAVLFKMTWG